jgi:CDP-diacylglycerol--glycerol-3-phosphate 3-phosphatidyltransferase
MVKTRSKVPDASTESAPSGDTAPAKGGLGRFSADIQTIPNLMSLARIVMILATAVLYLYGYRATALILGIFAGITDIFDGWLARKLNQVTELGAILDRLSDLIMETVAFGMLLHYRLVSPTLFIAYMLREYIIGSARLYVAEKGGAIPSSFLGKRKTNFVMGSFIGLFASHSGVIEASEMVYKVGYAMLIAGLVCSYLSGAIYLRSFSRIYNESKE